MTSALAKNFFLLIGAELFNKIITFAVFAYLARLAGAANFGYIEWAAAVLMCASLIVDQGFSAYGAREIAKNPSQTEKLVVEIVTARFLTAAIAYLAAAIFALWFVKEETVSRLILIYGLSLFALPFLLQWVFQGHDKMYAVSLTEVIRRTVFAVIVFAFVSGANDLLFVGAAETISVACAALFGLWLYNRKFFTLKTMRSRLSKKLFREAAPIGLSQIFWTFKMFGATLILGLVATAEDTGLFAAAMRIFVALHVFVWFYYFNLSPSLARAWQENGDKFAELIKNSMKIILPLSAAGGIIWFLAAPMVMTVVYGQDFSRGVTALQWLGGACAAAAVSGHYRFGLIAANFQSGEMLTSAGGACAAAFLIPLGYLYAGINGAAAALLAVELLILISSAVIFRRLIFGINQPQKSSPGNLPEAAQ